MLFRFEQGERRAQTGRPIVVEAVRGMDDSTEATSYIMGYMRSVVSTLGGIGISDPQDLGIHESFMHIVVQDQRLEGTTGIEGLADGTRGIAPKDGEYTHLGQSAWNHYRDGHKIGFAFARANIRKGNFAALAHASQIPEQLQRELLPEMQAWLEGLGITQVKPELVLNFHPVAREVFSYIATNGNDGLEGFIGNTVDRVTKSSFYDDSKKAEIIAGIGKVTTFARKARNLKSF